MKTRTPDQVLDEIAREGVGQDINLSSGLQAKMRKGLEKQMKTKKVILTGAAAFVLVIVILASIPSVVQAVKRLLGYVPGTGFVEQSTPLRILKEPVEIKSGDTTISVSQGVSDSEHTTLIYQIDNIPGADTTELEFNDICRALPSLQLSDGGVLNSKTITGNFWGSSLSRQLEFDSVPADENMVKLIFPCIEGSLLSADAAQIELSLEFVLAPADMTVYPLVNLPTPTIQISETSLPNEQNSAASQILLELSKYVQTDDQLILFGAVKTESTDFRLSILEFNAVHLMDKDGNAIPIEEDYSLPDPEGENRRPQNLLFTFRTAGRFIPGEASLVIDSLWIQRDASASFSFDPGPNPQPGQTWTLNQTLEVNGYSILIKDATKNSRDGGLGFTYESPENVTNVTLMDLEHPLLGGGGGSTSTGFTYRDDFPSGKITITLTSYDEKITGPWQTTLTLPTFADGVLPTPTPEACLTKATWDAALISSYREIPVLPESKLILSDFPAPDFLYHVFSADLSSIKPVDLGPGDSGALSPDGQTLVYATDEGLKFRTLATGEVTAIAGTTRRDRGPVWSADGTQIAFSRGPASGLIGTPGPYDLMLMDADGSNQTTLLADAEANTVQAWMPHSPIVLYTVRGPEGAAVKTINTLSGEVTWLTDLNYQNAGVAVSPNGRQIAYEAMLPGDNYGVYISSLDGSNARLIANGDPLVVTNAQWSPNGEWLAMTVQGDSSTDYSLSIAMVNPNTCQVIATASLKGYVTSWR